MMWRTPGHFSSPTETAWKCLDGSISGSWASATSPCRVAEQMYFLIRCEPSVGNPGRSEVEPSYLLALDIDLPGVLPPSVCRLPSSRV